MSEQAAAAKTPLRLAQAAAQIRSDLPLAVLDAALVAGGYVGVLFLRFIDDGVVPAQWWRPFGLFLPVAVVVHLALNWLFGLYGQMWRHAGVQEARRVLLAGLTATIGLGLGFVVGDRKLPASVVLLGGAIVTMLVGGLRFQSRLLAFRRGGDRRLAVRVVVIGAGSSGAAIVREMALRPEHGLVPVAVLDDDPRKQGRSLSGVPIIGGVDRLQDAVAVWRAEQALLAIPSADGELVRRVANAADSVGLTLKVLPSVAEIVGGQVSVRDVRDLSIVDLLGRQQVTTDLAAVHGILHDRRVLITGAGGSIGSEIARQVAACRPAALLLLDHDETHLFDLAGSLSYPYTQLLADIRDRDLVDALVARHRPQVVFHAAAHKHVPLLEAHPSEAVATNVLGTANLAEAAVRHGVERFVLISTDKAVRPSSVMGASKRLGEQIVLSQAPPGRRYCAVRFGNVLGSRGSVIPTFMRQIQRGGPVTVTDPRMTRFFMSIEEAVQLVLQAAAFADGGEVFMLEMG
ncbi:MAG: polysaccharide biosynthesis protein, partial [Actinomycetota bacterium]|nr:polysaccharide biosynthesis protein [Actinomycetota bacterium]